MLIEAMRNSESALTGRLGERVLHALPLDHDQPTVLDDAIDQARHAGIQPPLLDDAVDVLEQDGVRLGR
ncbi:hypothetical protein CSW58_12315, partial [Caulobacter sp. B11]